MRNLRIWSVPLALCLLVACTPRDFLTRRLAGDLIAGSDTFKQPQQFWLRTGVISNADYFSPEYLVLQRRGWITGANVPCTADVGPRTANAAGATPGKPSAQPCWDVALTPLGVETFRDLIPDNAAPSRYFSVQAARRELVAISGISKDGNSADVDFTWKWTPLNEVGAALHQGGLEYRSTVAFRHYDDGWRVMEAAPKSSQGLDEALKNAEAVP